MQGPQSRPTKMPLVILTGGIDEVRIYNRALSYGQVMDDHYQCTAAPGTGILSLPTSIPPAFLTSGTLTLGTGETVTRKLTFSNQVEEGIWHVYVPSGSQLTVGATDAYSEIYRDEWYVELKDRDTRLTRVVAFPVANNAPVTGTIASGNATVLVHYFGGPARFPAGVSVTFTCARPGNPCIVTSKGNSRIPHYCDLFCIMGDADCSCRSHSLGP